MGDKDKVSDEDAPPPAPDDSEARELAREREEWEQLRREANAIDPYQYRRRGRIIAAVGVGALGAALVWVVLALTDSSRNPCQRVRDHFCARDAKSASCTTYDAIYRDSVDDDSPKMRSLIREQCLTKIRRLAEEDGVKVR